MSSRVICFVLALTAFLRAYSMAGEDKPMQPVFLGKDGKLEYAAQEIGDRVPDFSHCGYMGGGVSIPNATVRIAVEPVAGDATALIQAAIDKVSAMPVGEDGLRGAVLLLKGKYKISGQLKITKSGVVLRGCGDGENGTVLVAAGNGRRTLINVGKWTDFPDLDVTARQITDKYVPVGAKSFEVADAGGLKVGDAVTIHRPCKREWISAIGMDSFKKGWRPQGRLNWVIYDQPEGTRDVLWRRIVTGVEGNRISVDVPLTTALDVKFGGGRLFKYDVPGRVRNCGVENLRCVSEYNPDNPLDEEHSWVAVQVLTASDVWVRNVTAKHFACSAVSLEPASRKVTVVDCRSLAPISEIAGARRRSFYAGGQSGLFLRCTAEQGRHDFAAGLCAAGPDAFVDCTSTGAIKASGPIESWASGVLYDNVTVKDGRLHLGNRGEALQGMGWCSANCMLWNCTAAEIRCENPPTAANWAIGCTGKKSGNGGFHSHGTKVAPASLYRQQLIERLGENAALALKAAPISSDPGKAPRFAFKPAAPKPAKSGRRLQIVNGWFVNNGKAVWGRTLRPSWYHGQMLPQIRCGRNIARWSPCKVGRYLTEDLAQLADDLLAMHAPMFEHSYGLWYERRRVNHDTPKRPDAEVWPPFLEQPWARSGRGQAWDGLSKYDLTKFNPWYFSRMREFAEISDAKGTILYYNCYEQHNLLENRGHWVDSPWRPVNCLQKTELPHTLPAARQFYDTTHPLRSKLQKLYLTKVLDELGEYSSVIYMPSKEFTGPLPWARVWVDTIMEWEKKNNRQVYIGLMCTKDVVDAILEDPVRGPAISVIDMRLWWYMEDGTLYAPEGGKQTTPRGYEAGLRHKMKMKNPLKQTPQQLYRKVREYRDRYPDKALISSGREAGAWPVFMAGGSMSGDRPNHDAKRKLVHNVDFHLCELIENHLSARVQRLKPNDLVKNDPKSNWCLADPGNLYLAYASAGGPLVLDITGATGKFQAKWFDPATGKLLKLGDGTVDGGAVRTFNAPNDKPWALLLSK